MSASAVVVAALIAAAGTAPPTVAGAAVGVGTQCLRDGEKVIKRTPSLLVIRGRKREGQPRYFTCWGRTGRRATMLSSRNFLAGVRPPVGRWVLFFYNRVDRESGILIESQTYMGLFDAKAARRYSIASTYGYRQFSPRPLLMRTGSVAFIGPGGYFGGGMRLSPAPIPVVVACEMPACYGGQGHRGQGTRLDWGDVDPASLSASGGLLFWTNGGLPRSAPFL